MVVRINRGQVISSQSPGVTTATTFPGLAGFALEKELFVLAESHLISPGESGI
ncbi:MAG: hypothetical protein J2P13_01065 [Acidobacteria bacterium]|nr:hypothetical protein [Acidobacteriota bacterium]